MSKFKDADVEGCNYTMEVLTPYFNSQVNWEHTSVSKGNDFYKYDMDWSLSDGRQASVENKDRRFKWVDGEKTDIPQYYSTYPTVMYNIDKVDYQLALYHTIGTTPLYTAGYTDGVAVFDISLFPDDWRERWKETRLIPEKSAEKSKKIPQERIMLPKSYAYFYPKDHNKPIEIPTYDETDK